MTWHENLRTRQAVNLMQWLGKKNNMYFNDPLIKKKQTKKTRWIINTTSQKVRRRSPFELPQTRCWYSGHVGLFFLKHHEESWGDFFTGSCQFAALIEFLIKVWCTSESSRGELGRFSVPVPALLLIYQVQRGPVTWFGTLFNSVVYI